MNLTGLLNAFNELPAWKLFMEAVDNKEPLPPLQLGRSARPAILAQLFRERCVPIVLISGRIDTIGQWQQALETWLPDNEKILRLPEPTPLPYEHGPWSDRSR
jgi:hypothetical protein